MELEDRLKYAKRALDGIALGDCFGQTFFVPDDEAARQRIKDRAILKEPWHFTDDTVMAIGIYRILEKYKEINQDELAKIFAGNYVLDWHRDMEEQHILFCVVSQKEKIGGKQRRKCLTKWVLWEMVQRCALHL